VPVVSFCARAFFFPLQSAKELAGYINLFNGPLRFLRFPLAALLLRSGMEYE